MSELQNKVKKAIERIRSFESVADNHADDDGKTGYYLAFSGGKDSVAVKALMDMAGVKYDAHYRITSVDPPELVRFIKDQNKDVSMDKPRYPDTETYGKYAGKQVTMWNLIPRKSLPPTRVARYCCEWLKEDGGDGRFTVTGVRWAESYARRVNQGAVTITGNSKTSKTLADSPDFRQTEKGGVVLVNDNSESRAMIDACVTRHKTCLNPIIDWTDDEVWEFIRSNHIPYCELYDDGWHRLGCVGCPMAGTRGREKEFIRWPKYKAMYIAAFDRMLKEREKKGKMEGSFRLTTPIDVYNWWMQYDVLPGQMNLFGEDET